MQLVDELHKQAVILILKIFNAQTTICFFLTNPFPSQQATRAMSFFFTSP